MTAYDEADACKYCGKGLYQEESDRGFAACDDCAEREGLLDAIAKGAIRKE